MRLEIVVPDSTSASVKGQWEDLAHRLSVEPELVEGIDLRSDSELRSVFTPDVIREIEEAEARIDSGQGQSIEEVEARLLAYRAAWKKTG